MRTFGSGRPSWNVLGEDGEDEGDIGLVRAGIGAEVGCR